MSRRAESVLVQRYPQLVRAAYLILAGERREDRLIKAHRVVQSALPWREPQETETAELYRTLLVRVVRTALRQPWWLRMPRRPVPWLRAATALGTAEHTALDLALAEAEPEVRAAYTLLVAESAPDREVIELLSEAGVRSPRMAIATAEVLHDQLWDDGGLGPDSQAKLLQDAALDPTVARLHPGDLLIRRGIHVLGGALAIALVAALVFGITTLLADEPAPENTLPVPVAHLVPADTWRTTTDLTLDAWPTRGSRKDDTALRGDAVRAWTAGRQVSALNGTVTGPPAGPVRTLFAGDVDGHTVAILTDDSRIARYLRSGDTATVTLAPKPRRDPEHSSAVRLTPSTSEARYLLAPWITRAQVATVGGSWRPVVPADGVTPAVSGGTGGAACWSGPVLRLTSAEVRGGRPYTLADFGTATPARALFAAGSEVQEMDAPGGPSLWSRLSCSLGALRGISLDGVTTSKVWSGRLPETDTPAHWVCTRADAPGGTSLVTGELLAPGAPAPQRSGARSATRLCSDLAPDLVMVTWWQAPSKQWYLVAAGSSGVERISLGGLPGTVTRRDGMVAVGPFDAPKPKAPIAVKATNARGSLVPVLS